MASWPLAAADRLATNSDNPLRIRPVTPGDPARDSRYINSGSGGNVLALDATGDALEVLSPRLWHAATLGSPAKAPGRIGAGRTLRAVASPDMAFDDNTLQAIGELLALGEQEGFGITFTPDPEGWTVGYMRGMGGGDLLSGFDLGDTARAAMRPLLDLAARYEVKRREREGQER
jgi:hypothetical protein